MAPVRAGAGGAAGATSGGRVGADGSDTDIGGVVVAGADLDTDSTAVEVAPVEVVDAPGGSSLQTASHGPEMRAASGVDHDGTSEPYSYEDGPPTGDARLPLASPFTQSRVGGAVGLVVGLLMLGPWLWSGDLLVRDLVAVAGPALNLDALAPGAGPSWDLLGRSMAVLAGQFLGMDTVVRIVLVTSFVALGAGAGRLAGTNGSRVAAAVAAMAATWNPFVWGRLNQGEWLAILALAALPWVVIHLRADHRWRLARVVALAGIAGAAGWMIVVPTLLVVAVAARRIRAAVPALLVLVATTVPAMISAGRFEVDPAGFEAMSAQADLPSGLITSVVTGGGHWNLAVAAPSRSSWLVALLAIMIAGASMYGAGRWREAPRLLHDWRTRSGLALAAIIGLVGVVFMTTAAGQAVMAGLTEVVPWLVVTRNSTDLLAPWVVILAIGLGHLSWRTVSWLRQGVLSTTAVDVRGATGFGVGIAAMVLVVMVMPDPRGAAPLPDAAEVSASWLLAARMVNADPDGGSVLLVPGTRYQDFAMTDQEVRPPLQVLAAKDVLGDSQWTVTRDATSVTVDDQPPVPIDPRAQSEPTPDPEATTDVEGDTGVVIDAASIDEQVAPTTTGPTPVLVRTLASQWPDQLAGQQLAELGVEWVAVIQPDQIADPGNGLVQAMVAPDIQLLRVDPDQYLIARTVRPLWPLLVDGLIATMLVALLLAAGPLRTGKEMDPV